MKRVNMSMLAEAVLFFLLAILLFLLAISDVYKYYVTPRTLPFLYFAAVMMLLLCVFACFSLFEKSHVKHYSHLLILLIPLVMIIWSVNDADGLTRLFHRAPAKETETAYGTDTYTMKASAYEGVVLTGYDGENKRLAISQEETYFWLAEIFENPDPFLGFTVTTMGQVMKDPQYFEDGCFSPVRQLMTCCTADLYPIGFTCEYADTDSLQKDEWVIVTGILTLQNFEEYSELRIVADSVTPCAPSLDPYVYSY